jgi:hypothetical protein
VLKNVTTTLPEEALRWARHEAAERGTSVSKLLGELIAREMQSTQQNSLALRRSMERSKKGWSLDADHRLTREQAHERKR